MTVVTTFGKGNHCLRLKCAKRVVCEIVLDLFVFVIFVCSYSYKHVQKVRNENVLYRSVFYVNLGSCPHVSVRAETTTDNAHISGGTLMDRIILGSRLGKLQAIGTIYSVETGILREKAFYGVFFLTFVVNRQESYNALI